MLAGLDSAGGKQSDLLKTTAREGILHHAPIMGEANHVFMEIRRLLLRNTEIHPSIERVRNIDSTADADAGFDKDIMFSHSI